MATSAPNRRQATRSARTTASRPTNYYAKPFSYRSSGPGLIDNDPPLTTAPGFFPAITHFTDSIAALPKEVQRHLTTLKETEGKAYQPDEAVAELVTAINTLPPPPHPLHQDRPLPFMQLAMANSANGSVAGSVVDGVAPKSGPSHLGSDLDLPDATASQTIDEFGERRNHLYRQLHFQVGEMAKILEEKNMVLTSMNETLSRQLARAESSFPHIENEVSEDARLGSNTHWALPHMKDLRRTNGAPERRRDVTNVNNLAAAAAAVHENDIAATRSEARREAMLAKKSRAPAADYGFDDRTAGRKSSSAAKIRRAPEPAPTTNGSSSANKRRRVEKPVNTQSERAMSAALHGRLQQPARSNSRDTSTADAARKKPKPAPVSTTSRKRSVPTPRRSPRILANEASSKTTNSPSLASSPTRATFTTATARAQSPARASSSRARQTSVTSAAQDAARKRSVPDAASRKQEDNEGPLNMAARDARAGTEDAESNQAQAHVEARRPASAMQPVTDAAVKPEPTTSLVTDPPASAPLPSGHSRSNSKSTGAPGKPSTPHNIFADVAPLMSRSRSGRGGAGGSSINSPGASTPVSGAASPSKRSHKRSAGSNANARDAATALGGGLAGTPASSEDEAGPGKLAERTERVRRSRKPKGTTSTGDPGDVDGDDGDAENATASTADLEVSGGSGDADADADDGEGEAETEGAEELYCFCQKPSEGEMIACDNETCPTEWFHLECVALTRAPKNSWFCSEGCKRAALRGKR